MGDESGESMEQMDEVPLKELGDAELERLQCVVDGGEPGIDSRDEGKNAVHLHQLQQIHIQIQAMLLR